MSFNIVRRDMTKILCIDMVDHILAFIIPKVDDKWLICDYISRFNYEMYMIIRRKLSYNKTFKSFLITIERQRNIERQHKRSRELIIANEANDRGAIYKLVGIHI